MLEHVAFEHWDCLSFKPLAKLIAFRVDTSVSALTLLPLLSDRSQLYSLGRQTMWLTRGGGKKFPHPLPISPSPAKGRLHCMQSASKVKAYRAEGTKNKLVSAIKGCSFYYNRFWNISEISRKMVIHGNTGWSEIPWRVKGACRREIKRKKRGSPQPEKICQSTC